MDLKKLFRLMLIVLVVVLGTNLVMTEFFAPKQHKVAKVGAGSKSGSAIGSAALAPPVKQINPAKVEYVTLGDSKAGAPFNMAVKISNVSAGVVGVDLNSALYRARLDSQKPLVLLRHRKGFPLAFGSQTADLPGVGLFNLNVPWSMEKVENPQTTAKMAYELLDAKNQPLVKLGTGQYEYHAAENGQSPAGN